MEIRSVISRFVGFEWFWNNHLISHGVDILRIMMPNRAFASAMAFVAGMVLCEMFDAQTAFFGILMIISTYSSQAVYNNLKDIDGDSVNAPERPLVNGSITLREAKTIMYSLIVLGFVFAYIAAPILIFVNILYICLGIIYSAFTKSTWYLSYLTLTTTHLVIPLATGYLIYGQLDYKIMIIIAFVYLTEGFIWSIKDYKDVHGDEKMGVNSLPVSLKPEKAAKVTFATLCTPLAFAWIPWHFLELSIFFIITYMIAGVVRAYLGSILLKDQTPRLTEGILKNFRYVLFIQMIAWCMA